MPLRSTHGSRTAWSMTLAAAFVLSASPGTATAQRVSESRSAVRAAAPELRRALGDLHSPRSSPASALAAAGSVARHALVGAVAGAVGGAIAGLVACNPGCGDDTRGEAALMLAAPGAVLGALVGVLVGFFEATDASGSAPGGPLGPILPNTETHGRGFAATRKRTDGSVRRGEARVTGPILDHFCNSYWTISATAPTRRDRSPIVGEPSCAWPALAAKPRCAFLRPAASV